MKYQTKACEGYWQDEPDRLFPVTIALGEWDGIDDDADQEIFFYMDGEPLSVGTVISEGFVVTEIED